VSDDELRAELNRWLQAQMGIIAAEGYLQEQGADERAAEFDRRMSHLERRRDELQLPGNWSAHRVVISLFRASRVGPRQA
jgi:hypothetical protein